MLSFFHSQNIMKNSTIIDSSYINHICVNFTGGRTYNNHAWGGAFNILQSNYNSTPDSSELYAGAIPARYWNDIPLDFYRTNNDFNKQYYLQQFSDISLINQDISLIVNLRDNNGNIHYGIYKSLVDNADARKVATNHPHEIANRQTISGDLLIFIGRFYKRNWPSNSISHNEYGEYGRHESIDGWNNGDISANFAKKYLYNIAEIDLTNFLTNSDDKYDLRLYLDLHRGSHYAPNGPYYGTSSSGAYFLSYADASDNASDYSLNPIYSIYQNGKMYPSDFTGINRIDRFTNTYNNGYLGTDGNDHLRTYTSTHDANYILIQNLNITKLIIRTARSISGFQISLRNRNWTTELSYVI